MDVSDLWLILMVPWVILQCVIVVFPDHTHLRFSILGTMARKANSPIWQKLVCTHVLVTFKFEGAVHVTTFPYIKKA